MGVGGVVSFKLEGRGNELQMGPRRPSDEASGPVCIQQIHHMNTRLYTGLVALRCAQRKAEEGRQATGGGASVPQHQHRWNSFASRALLRQDRHHAASAPDPGTQTTVVLEFRHLRTTRSCRQRQQLWKWIH